MTTNSNGRKFWYGSIFVVIAALLVAYNASSMTGGGSDNGAVANSFSGTDQPNSKMIAQLSDEIRLNAEKYDELLVQQKNLQDNIDNINANMQFLLQALQRDNQQSGEPTDFNKPPENSNQQLVSAASATPVPNEEEFKQQLRDQFYQLKTQALNEAEDASWSEVARQEIAELVQSKNFEGTNELATDCRSNSCVIDVVHSDENAMMKFQEEFPMSLGWENVDGHFQQSEENGQLVTSFIVTRQTK